MERHQLLMSGEKRDVAAALMALSTNPEPESSKPATQRDSISQQRSSPSIQAEDDDYESQEDEEENEDRTNETFPSDPEDNQPLAKYKFSQQSTPPKTSSNSKRRRGMADPDEDPVWRPNGKPPKRQKKSPSPDGPQTKRKYTRHQMAGKVSFMDAAIKVVADQRKKGIYALSTRKIWELIQRSELIATSCKTPVSSLSSRITQDVKTKGKNSTFIRVAEGLYSLREGFDQAQLDKFVATYYPNLGSGGRLRDVDDGFDEGEGEEGMEIDEDDLEESEEEEIIPPQKQRRQQTEQKKLPPAEPKKHEKAKPQRSPSVSTPSPNLSNVKKESPLLVAPVSPKILLPHASWKGLPLQIKAHSIYYPAVTIGSNTYKIGDCAYFRPNSETEKPYVGKIVKLWQNLVQDAQHNQDYLDYMLVKCIWYLYPEETHTGRTKKMMPNELFLTDITDVNSINSLLSPVQILTHSEFTKLPKNQDTSNIFFCRSSYINDNFIPFEIGEHGNITGPFSNVEEASPFDHWPQEVAYSSKLISLESPSQLRELALGPSPKINLLMPSEGKYAVVALEDIAAGQIVGECTGYLRVLIKPQPKQETSSSSHSTKNRNPSPSFEDDSQLAAYLSKPQVLVLQETEICLIVLDSLEIGNELRFLADAATSEQPANVTFAPHQIGNDWHLFVIALRPIKQHDLLIADFSIVKTKFK